VYFSFRYACGGRHPMSIWFCEPSPNHEGYFALPRQTAPLTRPSECRSDLVVGADIVLASRIEESLSNVTTEYPRRAFLIRELPRQRRSERSDSVELRSACLNRLISL